MMLVCRLSPAARRLATTHGVRLWATVWLNLAGHVWLDAFNVYGVHPFYPFDSRWYYGDAVFIFEPALWLLLGIAAIGNARRRVTRVMIGALVAALLIAVAALGVVPRTIVVWLGVTGAALAVIARHAAPRVRSAVALAASAVFMIGMFGVSRMARAETLAAIEPDRRGALVDVILSPDPAVPVCWSVIVIERDDDAGQYVLRRGTLSLLPASHPPASCASRRFTIGGAVEAQPGAARWHGAKRFGSRSDVLRELHDRDCWVRAWLQFGRAPVIRDGRILDLRFDTGARGNFTAMTLSPDRAAAGCPAHVTPWAAPRGPAGCPIAGADRRR